jgi:chorismate synthase
LQAVKAVEIGRGVVAAESFGSAGSRPHPLRRRRQTGQPTRFTRPQNNAGGIEGGVSNGEDIVVRGYLKPISTLRKPLESVRFDTREATSASYERSDICVVPAAGVVGRGHGGAHHRGLAQEKFGGDSALEMKRNFDGYIEQIRSF